MTEPTPTAADPETRRALQLDALAAILPMDRRDQLAKILGSPADLFKTAR
jgi:hypothetical protein